MTRRASLVAVDSESAGRFGIGVGLGGLVFKCPLTNAVDQVLAGRVRSQICGLCQRGQQDSLVAVWKGEGCGLWVPCERDKKWIEAV